MDLRSGVDFQSGPQAWMLARQGKIAELDPYTIPGGGPGAPAVLRGMMFIAHNVMHDLAALDKKELLLWEDWGARNEYADEVPLKEAAMLDEVSAVIGCQNVKVEDMKKFMARGDMKIPDTTMLYDPYASAAPPKPVDVSRVLMT